VDGDELPQINVYFLVRLTGLSKRRILFKYETSASLSANTLLNLNKLHYKLNTFFGFLNYRIKLLTELP
jgi:hypothetical protein